MVEVVMLQCGRGPIEQSQRRTCPTGHTAAGTPTDRQLTNN